MAAKRRLIKTIALSFVAAMAVFAIGCAPRQRVASSPQMQAAMDAMIEQQMESQRMELEWMLDMIRVQGKKYEECRENCLQTCWRSCKLACANFAEDWLECSVDCWADCDRDCEAECRNK